MIKKSKHKVYQECLSGSTGWDAAIALAKDQLSLAKFRVSQLKVAIKVLTEQKTAGVKWQDYSSTRN